VLNKLPGPVDAKKPLKKYANQLMHYAKKFTFF